MIPCPRCGFNNSERRQRCLRCEADLYAPSEPLPKIRTGIVARGLPGRAILARIRTFRELLIPRLFPTPSQDLPFRSPFWAAMLSLIPGLGQIFNHQRNLGLVHFTVFVLLIGSGIAIILNPWSNAFFLLAYFWMIYSINQAMLAAQEINGSTTLGVRRWRTFFLIMFLTAFVQGVAQWVAIVWLMLLILVMMLTMALASEEGVATHMGRRQRNRTFTYIGLFLIANILMMAFLPGFFFRSVVSMRRIGQTAYAPFIMKNDRILYESVVFGIRGPQLGDIIVFDPPRFSIEDAQNNLYLVNMPVGMERIIGLPGDLIERRDGVWYRNGVEAPPEEQPLVQDQLWDNLELQVPMNEYAVLASYGPTEWVVIGTFKAPPLKSANVHGWHEASTVPVDVMYGRAVCVYAPAPRRRWLNK